MSIFACMSICILHTSLMSLEAWVVTRAPHIRVTGGCELPCVCDELSPSHLEEQPLILTAEPNLQFHLLGFLHPHSGSFL